jgi:hypothetical protein
MSTNKPSALTLAIVTGALTILGATSGSILKSFSDIEVERTKLDSQLLLHALNQDSADSRRSVLKFLVDAKLIANKDTEAGLEIYLNGKEEIPQIKPFLKSGESRELVRKGEDLARKTDIDIYRCGKDKTNKKINDLVASANEVIDKSGSFGRGREAVWDEDSYDEIPLKDLTGKTTVIMDFKHDEFKMKEGLEKILGDVPGIPKIKTVDNTGDETAWRVSVILCTE